MLSGMTSHSGNRSGHRPPDMQMLSQRDTGSPNFQSSSSSTSATTSGFPTARNRVLLAEAVDSVVNTFAKHARGYGRGRLLTMYSCNTKIMLTLLISWDHASIGGFYRLLPICPSVYLVSISCSFTLIIKTTFLFSCKIRSWSLHFCQFVNLYCFVLYLLGINTAQSNTLVHSIVTNK